MFAEGFAPSVACIGATARCVPPSSSSPASMWRPSWLAPARRERGATPHVTALGSCGPGLWPSGAACTSVAEWFDDQPSPCDEDSATSDGSDSESESQHSCPSFADAGGPSCRGVIPPSTEFILNRYADFKPWPSAAEAASSIAAAREDELEITEWYEEQRARDNDAQGRRPSAISYAAARLARFLLTRTHAASTRHAACTHTHARFTLARRCLHCLYRLRARCRRLLCCRCG